MGKKGEISSSITKMPEYITINNVHMGGGRETMVRSTKFKTKSAQVKFEDGGSENTKIQNDELIEFIPRLAVPIPEPIPVGR